MEVKLVHTFDETETDKIKRILRVDEAFSLLWDVVHDDIRSYFKYLENPTKEDAEKLLEKIRDNINESGLLELYN